MKHQDIVSAFVKATASQGPNTNCVEIARTADGGRAVRDSKNHPAGTQFHSPAPWAAFLHGVKSGGFTG